MCHCIRLWGFKSLIQAQYFYFLVNLLIQIPLSHLSCLSWCSHAPQYEDNELNTKQVPNKGFLWESFCGYGISPQQYNTTRKSSDLERSLEYFESWGISESASQFSICSLALMSSRRIFVRIFFPFYDVLWTCIMINPPTRYKIRKGRLNVHWNV